MPFFGSSTILQRAQTLDFMDEFSNLQAYNFKVEHRPGLKHSNADSITTFHHKCKEINHWLIQKELIKINESKSQSKQIQNRFNKAESEKGIKNNIKNQRKHLEKIIRHPLYPNSE